MTTYLEDIISVTRLYCKQYKSTACFFFSLFAIGQLNFFPKEKDVDI
jgi:hypothetical protein